RHPTRARRANAQPFEMAHHIVSGEANQSTGEWHTADVRLWTRRAQQRRAQLCEQCRRARRNRQAFLSHYQPVRIEAYLESIAEADEGKPTEPLASFDALEQKARPERGELHERRNRRVEISGDVENRLQCPRSP